MSVGSGGTSGSNRSRARSSSARDGERDRYRHRQGDRDGDWDGHRYVDANEHARSTGRRLRQVRAVCDGVLRGKPVLRYRLQRSADALQSGWQRRHMRERGGAPTLTLWALLVAALLLVAIAAFALQRRSSPC